MVPGGQERSVLVERPSLFLLLEFSPRHVMGRWRGILALCIVLAARAGSTADALTLKGFAEFTAAYQAWDVARSCSRRNPVLPGHHECARREHELLLTGGGRVSSHAPAPNTTGLNLQHHGGGCAERHPRRPEPRRETPPNQRSAPNRCGGSAHSVGAPGNPGIWPIPGGLGGKLIPWRRAISS